MGLQHVTLEVSADQRDDCLAFWELLGFEQVRLPAEAADRVSWVQHEGTSIHLLVTDEPVIPAVGHAAVVVESYDATLHRLRAAGFEPRPQTEYWGVPRAYIQDPAGHTVEVMAAAPPI